MNSKQLQELKKKMIVESGLYRDIKPSSTATASQHQLDNNHDKPIWAQHTGKSSGDYKPEFHL